jgi:hypothetical protein
LKAIFKNKFVRFRENLNDFLGGRIEIGSKLIKQEWQPRLGRKRRLEKGRKGAFFFFNYLESFVFKFSRRDPGGSDLFDYRGPPLVRIKAPSRNSLTPIRLNPAEKEGKDLGE